MFFSFDSHSPDERMSQILDLSLGHKHVVLNLPDVHSAFSHVVPLFAVPSPEGQCCLILFSFFLLLRSLFKICTGVCTCARQFTFTSGCCRTLVRYEVKHDSCLKKPKSLCAPPPLPSLLMSECDFMWIYVSFCFVYLDLMCYIYIHIFFKATFIVISRACNTIM